MEWIPLAFYLRVFLCLLLFLLVKVLSSIIISRAAPAIGYYAEADFVCFEVTYSTNLDCI